MAYVQPSNLPTCNARFEPNRKSRSAPALPEPQGPFIALATLGQYSQHIFSESEIADKKIMPVPSGLVYKTWIACESKN